MRLTDLITQFAAPKSHGKATAAAKSSAAGPLIAWSQTGQPRWTHRRYDQLAEQGFRKNVIAYRCVMQVSTASSAIPWLLYDGGGGELDRHPLLDLLRHPNPLQDGTAFLESVYAYLQIAGNAYIEAVKPDDADAPVELYALRPDRMKVIPGPAGLPEGYQYTVNGQVTTWPADPITGESSILHIRQFHPLDDWYGMAPCEAAQISVDQHNAAGSWNQALLNHGARPSGALVYAPKDGAGTLTDDQMHRLREELGMIYQGSRNAGRPLILEGGLDWREMSLSPKDMDWLAGRNVAARDIALAFGVPAQLVGIPDSQTYANMAEARMALYEETVLPLVGRVMGAFEHWLAPMYDEDLELDYDPDEVSALSARRDVQWNKLQGTDFLTINEKRHAIGYAPVEGGDVLDTGNKKPGAPAPNAEPAAPPALVAPFTSPFSTAANGNPNHDELGRFTFGPHVSDDDSDDGQSGDSGSDSDEDNDATGTSAANANLASEPLPKPSLSGDTQVTDASGETGSMSTKPAKDLSTSRQGVDFIAQHETFKPMQYQDTAGNPTIGFGHLLQPGELYPNGITREDAEQLLAHDIGTAETTVQNGVKVPLTQSQFDALTSFVYNVGAGAFRGSTLLHLLNQGDYDGAANQFPLWNHDWVDGIFQVDPGLTNRRNDEQNLFLNGDY